jgi:four helix bundle protein
LSIELQIAVASRAERDWLGMNAFWPRLCNVRHMTQAEILKARTFDFAVAVFRLCRPLLRDPEARVPAGQLVRASASVAANYRASCRAKSKRDFIAKLGTVIEESDESLFWLQYLVATTLLTAAVTQKLHFESNEFVAIFTASQKTAQANYAREKNSRKARRMGLG